VGKLSPERIADFRKTILDHYKSEGRSFPWRETRDPYRILVSEIMLQQTQTDRVVQKYNEWLSVFPDAGELAAAPFSLVLEHWIGLGYNRRARYLQETCKAIVERYGGVFPQSADELRALPGLGPYTAAAVSTFSFGIPNVFIETNIRAVFIFFFFPESSDVTDRELLEYIAETIDAADPRTWYYALMDYGATLKKKVGNPNRKSRHYTVQSRFEGSLRQARGAILRQLRSGNAATLADIARENGLPYDRIAKAAEALLGEGFVAETDGVYRIA
jgi:A/G-specific adenine glycosylase